MRSLAARRAFRRPLRGAALCLMAAGLAGPLSAQTAAPPGPEGSGVSALEGRPGADDPLTPAFSRRIMEAASAYLGYVQTAGGLTGAYASGAGVADDVRIGAAYEPAQFQEGSLAAAAMAALQDGAFLEGVRRAVRADPAQGRALGARLLADPAAVLGIDGSPSAAARASGALRRQGDRLLEAGLRVKRASYAVQGQLWSKRPVAAPEARLAAAKGLSGRRAEPQADETQERLKRVLAEEGAAPLMEERSASPVVVRALALAALAVAGEAGRSEDRRIMAALSDERETRCLKMAKLNLFQCLAVAGPHYEDLFCLGQHALAETAQCVIASSGVDHPMTAVARAGLVPGGPTPRASSAAAAARAP